MTNKNIYNVSLLEIFNLFCMMWLSIIYGLIAFHPKLATLSINFALFKLTLASNILGTIFFGICILMILLGIWAYTSQYMRTCKLFTLCSGLFWSINTFVFFLVDPIGFTFGFSLLLSVSMWYLFFKMNHKLNN